MNTEELKSLLRKLKLRRMLSAMLAELATDIPIRVERYRKEGVEDFEVFMEFHNYPYAEAQLLDDEFGRGLSLDIDFDPDLGVSEEDWISIVTEYRNLFGDLMKTLYLLMFLENTVGDLLTIETLEKTCWRIVVYKK